MFASARRQYDFILSEPSNPWVSGVSGLFTDEFYHRVRTYLAPHGVFGQWLHLYEIDDELLLTVVRALHRNFPSYRMYLTMDVDILILASNDSTLPAPDWSVLQYPMVAADMKRFRPITPEALEGALLATRTSLAAAVRSAGAVNSDYHPLLDLGAERTRFRKLAATGFMETADDRFDLMAALDERRIGFGTETREGLRMSRDRQRARAARLRAHEPAPASDSLDSDRDYHEALVRLATLRDLMSVPHAPADWFHWFRGALDVEHDLHAGSMGVVDSVFYREIDQYMVKWKAPEAARSAWRFLEAAGTYNWPGVAEEVTPQLRARVAGHTWLPVDLLRDAGVLALLRTGQRETAAKVFDALAPFSTRSKTDLRTISLQQLVSGR